MPKYRKQLPQLEDRLFLTDGGIETTLIFLEGLELPDFAAFHLLQTDHGTDALLRYFRSYAELARTFGSGLVLESPTWRANADWGTRLGYSMSALEQANHKAIELLEQVRNEFEDPDTPMVVSGCIGPRGDGYVPNTAMNENVAADYHYKQIATFKETAADMVCAITMNYAEEAIGITRAAQQLGMPVAISFTVETDGRLPTGQSLRDAIEEVDNKTNAYSSYFMINCAHPAHLAPALSERATWSKRIHGLRANASRQSHAELNESTELDSGDPVELALLYADLKTKLPSLNVMGGCCGTDARHVSKIAETCRPIFKFGRP